MTIKDYIKSRLPEKLKEYKKCPHCGSKEFYIQKSSFLYFEFDIDGKIINVNYDHDDWNNTEETKCTECGVALE